MANNLLTGPPPCKFLDLIANEDAQMTVNATATVYGKSFLLPKNSTFGMLLQFSSVGTVNVKVELEQGIAPPATEGSSDANWGVGDTISAAITSTTTQVLAAAPVVTPYARLKLTGIAGNDAATYLKRCYFTFEKNL